MVLELHRLQLEVGSLVVNQSGLHRVSIAIAEFDQLVVLVEDVGSFLVNELVRTEDGVLEVIVFYKIATWRAANTIREEQVAENVAEKVLRKRFQSKHRGCCWQQRVAGDETVGATVVCGFPQSCKYPRALDTELYIRHYQTVMQVRILSSTALVGDRAESSVNDVILAQAPGSSVK